MAKESIHSIDKHCIFRETFDSEANVLRNGGKFITKNTPPAKNFTNGQWSVSNDNTNILSIVTNKIVGAKTIRIRFRPNSLTTYNQYIISGYLENVYDASIFFSSTDSIVSAITGYSGIYINGVYYDSGTNTFSPVVGEWLEIVAITKPLIEKNSFCFASFADVPRLGVDATFDLFEIYDYALSAEEVSNLYNNSRYKGLQNTNEILNVSAQNGSIVNKYTGDKINGSTVPALTVGYVDVVKDGEVNAMKFNGSNSYIDCGNYDDLTGDLTVAVWVKSYTLGEGGYGYVLSNGKFLIRFINNYRYYVYSDNTLFQFTDQLVTFDEWQFLVVKRKADGMTYIFVDGILNKTGTTGTPVAGTNLNIGSRNDYNYSHDGLISDLRIIKGLLTDEEISQLYTSEKHKYGK